MALEIKILDYGDIEWNRAFWVPGRDLRQNPRVLARQGSLILGGPYPVVVDTGYRSNQIMETLGHARAAIPRNMIEEPARAARCTDG